MELIEKQQAIDALRTCYDTETVTMDNGDEYINYGDAVGEIEQLPPIQSKLLQPWEVLVAQAVLPQPEQRWIPVTDEEPDLYKRVIVTWEYGSKRYTAEASRQERNGTTFYKAESPDLFRYNPLKVVAWQEKPEPWEGDAE